MNLLFEDMIKVTTENWSCRVWRQYGVEGISNDDLCAFIRDLLKSEEWDFDDALEKIAAHPGVNSVEIIDTDGNGVCVHKDWP